MHYLGQLLPYLTKDENLENFETLKKYRNKIEWKMSHFSQKKPFQKFLLDGRIPWKFTFWSKTQKCGKQKYLNFKHSTSYRMIMITCFSYVKVLKHTTCNPTDTNVKSELIGWNLSPDAFKLISMHHQTKFT